MATATLAPGRAELKNGDLAPFFLMRFLHSLSLRKGEGYIC